jgi:hypothetical protein
MLNPIKISESLLTKYLEAVGDLMCSPKPAVVEELAKAEKYFKAPAANKGEARNCICIQFTYMYAQLRSLAVSLLRFQVSAKTKTGATCVTLALLLHLQAAQYSSCVRAACDSLPNQTRFNQRPSQNSQTPS